MHRGFAKDAGPASRREGARVAVRDTSTASRDGIRRLGETASDFDQSAGECAQVYQRRRSVAASDARTAGRPILHAAFHHRGYWSRDSRGETSIHLRLLFSGRYLGEARILRGGGGGYNFETPGGDDGGPYLAGERSRGGVQIPLHGADGSRRRR